MYQIPCKLNGTHIDQHGDIWGYHGHPALYLGNGFYFIVVTLTVLDDNMVESLEDISFIVSSCDLSDPTL